MRRRILGVSAWGALLAGASGVDGAVAQERKPHRIAIHVGGADPALMAVALNNITAAQEAYAAKGEAVTIELVANGGGFSMLRADISPVRDGIARIHALYPAVVFSACQNSRRAAADREHKTVAEVPELPEATDVPAGIVRLTELQEQGWTYIRV